MKEISKISIIVSFVALWITSRLENDVQTIIGFVFIFSFGILHGANDLVLLKNLKAKKNRYFSFLTLYVTVVLISALLFLTIPVIVLFLFIAISAYHFGEQHFQDLEEYRWKWLKSLFYFVYGSFILLLLFYFHSIEVQKIIRSITSYDLQFFDSPFALIISGTTLLFFFVYNFFALPNAKKTVGTELIYLGVFAIIFKLGSLIWGFAIYFILWHSIPSLHDQIKFLYGKYSFSNFKLYFTSAFFYWAVSLLGIGILYFFLREEKLFDAVFFSFIAAITFPHAFVILNMFKKKF
ncbi:Brp/Blh family beta-carotene 15,15'-dioxygenase [Chryseobacterium sp. MP_3.2]|uniref:Brp/Blh family beta-carotene 15,15'-dioxygenase n=1 Tax=Chryseobacterium sp. MP_3.2 TaxID=3071712 RepID=UPI002DF9F5DD|nr:Brp/Blh family beta-carotene 15,15'-monooxygenase [Chryseobacterium sp. MP_3.2]